MPDIAYVNGAFGPLADARISIEDRGFQFADGVYEVIVAPGGQPFRMEGHLERFARSAEMIDLELDWAALDLPGVVAEGIRQCGYADTMVYIQITRGVMPRNHVITADCPPTVVATFKEKPVYDPEVRAQGIAVETVPEIRWAKCSVKSIALLPNVLLKNAARTRGFNDAIIVGPDGNVREATAANIFILREGTLLTPPATDAILHGVTRAYVLECAADLQIPYRETDFTVDELYAADEAFVTSSTQDVMPVTRVDDKTIGEGKPGAVTKRLGERFRNYT